MSSAAVAQINVRIERELKEAGDRGLERIGVTPSQAVRSLWRRAAQGAKEEQALRGEILGAVTEVEESSLVVERLAVLDRFESRQFAFHALLAEAGIDVCQTEPLTKDEVVEERNAYLIEKYGV